MRREKAAEFYNNMGRRNPFVFDEATIAKNQKVRIKVNRMKEMTRANRRKVDTNGIPTTGRTTVQDVMKRLVLGTPTVAQRAADAAFYSDVHKVLGRVFDDPEILAWLGSQRAASPARGITDLMRVLDAIKEDRVLPKTGPGSIGVAARTMEQLARGSTELSEGARAKISDFVDAALRKKTRRWMGEHPDFGGPAVVDRWGYRSWGFVDGDWQKLNPHLAADKINDHVYEFVARKYQELADEMNKVGFDDRKDWTVEEAQAMDWAAVQRYNGAEPEGMQYAFDLNARTLQTPAPPSEILASLEGHNIRQVEEPVTDLSGRTSVRVIGSPESYQAAAQELADHYGQAWIMRDAGSKANKPMVTISGENLIEHLEAAEAAGFTHSRLLPDGTAEVFAPKGGVNKAKVESLVKGIEEAGGTASPRRVELQVVNGRSGTRSHDLPSAAADQGSDLAAEAGAGPGTAAAGPARQGVKPPGPLRRLLTEESGVFDPQARFRQRPAEEQPLLYHGSPEGELETIDTLYHTKPWRGARLLRHHRQGEGAQVRQGQDGEGRAPRGRDGKAERGQAAPGREGAGCRRAASVVLGGPGVEDHRGADRPEGLRAVGA